MTALAAPEDKPHLSGMALWLAGMLLALANFVAILDISVANVSVPNIAGALGVSATQGTWLITSYAVAEAITVPLTGWLAARFGTVRVFVVALIGFGLASALCGLAPSLGLLVACRVLQGICGGPLMPLSQTLLLAIFPKRQQAAALGLWAVTTITAPILGPVAGGLLCDAFGWGAIFMVNVPVALIAGLAVWRVLARFETALQRHRMDFVGLGLLVVWVGALQIMLDLGRTHSWFQSPLITGLAVVALVGFVYFVIWELTDAQPVVDLRIFRYRGFSVGMAALAVTIGAFFAVNIITPLWLQTVMGYTAVWAGYANSLRGFSALAAAPVAAILMTRIDPRRIIAVGVLSLSVVTFGLAFSTTGASFGYVVFWMVLSGFGLPLFLLPLISLTLADIAPAETANASGLQSFIRTMATAVAISVATTQWENSAVSGHDRIMAGIRPGGAMDAALAAARLHQVKPLRLESLMDHLVQAQSVMLATNDIFIAASLLFLLCGLLVWLIPRPKGAVRSALGH